MASVQSSMKESGAAAARLAGLIIGALVLAAGAAWAQEPVQPRIDEEFFKQEKIYRRQGADVPGSYVTDRGLARYAEVLPSGFCAALAGLGGADRWLDIGAGQGQAILDYYSGQDAAAAERCAGSGPKARAVAVSIEDRRTGAWHQRAAKLAGRAQYLAGKRLHEYSPEELGSFGLITDVYGGFTYTADLSRFVERVLRLLATGGVFYTVLPSVHLEDGSHQRDTWFLTEVVDAASRPVTVCSWLKKIGCAKVTCETKRNWDAPTQLIEVRKQCDAVSVPSLRVVEYMAGAPPGRRFQMEQ